MFDDDKEPVLIITTDTHENEVAGWALVVAVIAALGFVLWLAWAVLKVSGIYFNAIG